MRQKRLKSVAGNEKAVRRSARVFTMKTFMPNLNLEQESHLFGLQGRFPVSNQQVIPVQRNT